MSDPSPAALIREFYSNLSIYSEVTSDHYFSSWILGQEFTITKQTVSEVLGLPLVHKPTYPYTEFLLLTLCHNFYPISHVYTVPIDRCAFLYALVTNGSMCFPSLFIQTIVDISRSKSKG